MKDKKNRIIQIATGICLLIILPAVLLWKNAPRNAYDIIFLGDSIFGNVQDATSVPALVGAALEMSSFNGGLGGTTASCLPENAREDVIANSASLFYLARAFSENNFSVILSAQPVHDEGNVWYFEDTVEAMRYVDGSQARYIIIEHGLNDYFYGREIGTIEDTTPVTFLGALRCSIEMLRDAFPEAEIVLVTPVYYGNEERIATTGASIAEYVWAEVSLAEDMNVLCYNAYAENFITAENVDVLTEDGVHLTEEGRCVLANGIVEFLTEDKR